MLITNYLKTYTELLESAGVETARLDALVLLEDVLGKDRAWILANPKTEILFSQANRLKSLLKRRAQHEPLAYIRGKTEFYGREFLLTPAVLEPRPESETMIDLLKVLVKNHYSDNQEVWAADVGAGSGALGITAALELPNLHLDLLEIDAGALQVAKTNVDKFTLNIKVIESDLLDKSYNKYAILLCNLPYVPDETAINQAARHEPKLAIFGGPDGLNIYRKLFDQIDGRANKPLYILTESLPAQHDQLAKIAVASGYRLAKSQDFIRVFELKK